MVVIGKAVLGFLIGGIVAAILVFFGGVLIGDLFSISQAEGAYAMGIAFFYTPAGFVIGGIIGAILAVRRKKGPSAG